MPNKAWRHSRTEWFIISTLLTSDLLLRPQIASIDNRQEEGGIYDTAAKGQSQSVP